MSQTRPSTSTHQQESISSAAVLGFEKGVVIGAGIFGVGAPIVSLLLTVAVHEFASGVIQTSTGMRTGIRALTLSDYYSAVEAGICWGALGGFIGGPCGALLNGSYVAAKKLINKVVGAYGSENTIQNVTETSDNFSSQSPLQTFGLHRRAVQPSDVVRLEESKNLNLVTNKNSH